MKIKKKYIPCEINIVKFDVELGFATSFESTKKYKNNNNFFIDFYMMKNSPSDPSGTRNQQYFDAGWGSVWEEPTNQQH